MQTYFSNRPSQETRCFVGFDGYIDNLFHVVKVREDSQTYEPFRDIDSFGRAISAMAGLSGDMELVGIAQRFGGNAPLMANALAALGLKTDLFASVGLPPHPCFSRMREDVSVVSLGNPGMALALEFSDGKVMLADNSPLGSLTAEMMRSSPHCDRLCASLRSCDLIALVNWSQIPDATRLWDMALMEAGKGERAPIAFFDLADYSKRTAADVDGLISMLGSSHGNMMKILGLNRNEANLMARHLGMDANHETDTLCALIASRLGLTVVIHALDHAAVSDGVDCALQRGRLVEKPVCLTGGGDHFNAGFCAALLRGMRGEDALRFAMGVSGAYVSQGRSPTAAEARAFLG